MTSSIAGGAGPSITRPSLGRTDVSGVLDVDGPVWAWVKPARRGWMRPQSGIRLVVHGAVLSRLKLRHRVGSQLLGPGDLLIDPAADGEPFSWECRALVPSAVATVDLNELVRDGHATAGVLLEGATRLAQALAEQHVAAQHTGLELRVASLLPRLAERWGVVSAQGVLLPAFLNHSVLSELLGVRRPSFTTAAARMDLDGSLRRLPDGRWLLGDQLDPTTEQPSRATPMAA